MSEKDKEIVTDIEHLKSVIVAVFKAELAIIDDWSERLKKAPQLSEKDRTKLQYEYITAIAEELLKNQK